MEFLLWGWGAAALNETSPKIHISVEFSQIPEVLQGFLSPPGDAEEPKTLSGVFGGEKSDFLGVKFQSLQSLAQSQHREKKENIWKYFLCTREYLWKNTGEISKLEVDNSDSFVLLPIPSCRWNNSNKQRGLLVTHPKNGTALGKPLHNRDCH